MVTSTAFAADVVGQLETVVSSESHDVLSNDLQKHVQDFTGSLGASATSRGEEIDGIGTSLWNLCTRLRRNYEPDKPVEVPSILLLARVFAFQLLNGALEASRSTTSNTVRLMKVGIKVTKNCLGKSLQQSR